MKLKFAVLVLLFVLVLTGCGAGPHAVKDAHLRDTIFSVEIKENYSYFVWVTHDDVGVYCTMNKDIYDKALAIFNDKSHAPEVILSYMSSNVGSSENPDFLKDPLGQYGCKHEKATVYVITDIQAVNS